MNDLAKLFYDISPYEELDVEEHPADMQGWASTDPLFREIISKFKPKIIVEVGSWKGASAIHMAKIVKELGLPSQIICVDTWLGSPEHFCAGPMPERRASLRMKNGFPQLYYTFLSNVVRNGASDIIIPVANSSANGATILHKLGIRVDFAYIDAAHEYNSVLADLRAYWPLVSDTGIIMGDDMFSHRDVTLAAHDFAKEVKLPMFAKYSKFIISKSKAISPRIVLD